MKLNVYSIFDTASGTYWKPIYAKSDGEIMRAFKDIATDAEHPVGQHPEDYSLYRVGIFDDNKGCLVPEDKECLATAQEVVALDRQKTRVVEGQKELLSAVE